MKMLALLALPLIAGCRADAAPADGAYPVDVFCAGKDGKAHQFIGNYEVMAQGNNLVLFTWDHNQSVVKQGDYTSCLIRTQRGHA